MEEERAVLLGVVQERQGVDNASPYVCKAGGTPAWYGEAPAEASELQCPKCGNQLFMVAQVYAPVDADRTLYVFGCNSVGCTEAPGSWRVLRDQVSEVEKASSSAETAVASVAAPVESAGFAWGGDGDDSDWSDDDDDASAPASSTTGTDLSDLEALLQQRDEAMQTTTSAAPVKKKAAPAVTTATTTSSGKVKAFPAMPIEVIDEPYEDYTAENDFSHENKLLEEYMRQEEEDKSEDVGDLRKIISATKKKNGGAGGGASTAGGSSESYEKTPAHQRHFMRFQKRINRCPLQCLRYDYGGEPLWPIPAPQNLVIPKCACGEDRVFELQLTPTINYFLKVDDFASAPSQVTTSDVGSKPVHAPGGGMDWLSLLVYSCPTSCDKSRSEFIHVLPGASA